MLVSRWTFTTKVGCWDEAIEMAKGFRDEIKEYERAPSAVRVFQCQTGEAGRVIWEMEWEGHEARSVFYEEMAERRTPETEARWERFNELLAKHMYSEQLLTID